MGVKNYLIEGVSGTGKTSVCEELEQRGFHAIHGDRELAYQGDPKTGVPLAGQGHAHHIWDVQKVKALILDSTTPTSFFCGGSRNFHDFIDLFDAVFVLEVDLGTLNRRLATRPPDQWGGTTSQRNFIARLHATKEDLPENAIAIDASVPLTSVVNSILAELQLDSPA